MLVFRFLECIFLSYIGVDETHQISMQTALHITQHKILSDKIYARWKTPDLLSRSELKWYGYVRSVTNHSNTILQGITLGIRRSRQKREYSDTVIECTSEPCTETGIFPRNQDIRRELDVNSAEQRSYDHMAGLMALINCYSTPEIEISGAPKCFITSRIELKSLVKETKELVFEVLNAQEVSI